MEPRDELLQTFEFECEFDYEYDFLETFRFDYEYDILKTSNTSLTTSTTS